MSKMQQAIDERDTSYLALLRAVHVLGGKVTFGATGEINLHLQDAAMDFSTIRPDGTLRAWTTADAFNLLTHHAKGALARATTALEEANKLVELRRAQLHDVEALAPVLSEKDTPK